MRLTLIRQILASFLIVCAGFALAWLITLYLLQQAADRLVAQSLAPDVAVAGLQQTRQLLDAGWLAVLLLGLLAFSAGWSGW